MTGLILPSKFIDYDFSIVPPGQNRGLLEDESKTEALMKAAPNFSDVFANLMVPKSEWKARIDKHRENWRKTVTQIYSQGSEGSCVGFGATQALETFLRRRYGFANWVSLSGMSVDRKSVV